MKKKILFIMCVFGILSSIMAKGINLKNLSLATTDNFISPKINSAALSFGNASGLGFMSMYDQDGFQENYSFFINSDHLA